MKILIRSSSVSCSQIALVLVCGLLASCSPDKPKQSVRYHMLKGATYKYFETFEMKNTSQISGREMSSSISGPIGILLTVEDTGKDGEFVCKGGIESALLTFESGNTKDSSTLQEIIGKSVRMVFSPTGKTLSIVPIDSMPMKIQKGVFNEFTPMKILPSILPRLPEYEVREGESWSVDSTSNPEVPGFTSSSSIKTTFTLEGTENVGQYDCFKILIEGEGTIRIEGKMPSGMESVVEMKPTVNGVAYVAQREGILVALELSGKTKQKASAGPMESTSEGTQIRNLKLVQERR